MRARPVRHSARRATRATAGVLVARVALLVVAALAVGCGPSASPPEPSPTPIERLNSTGMNLPRLEFCRLVPTRAVRAALGGRPTDRATWGNGDAPAQDGVPADRLHELGCAWAGPEGWAARAWVFAQPVEPPIVRQVVANAGREAGCRTPSGPAFGGSSYTQVCGEKDGGPRVRHAGLFGQTWLTCEVAGPGTAAVTKVRHRADAWCVAVASALDTTP